MADCCISPIKEVGKCILTECIWPPVKRHVDYWWCFDDNIQGLRDQIGSLAREKLSIDQKIEEVRLCAENASIEVTNWSNECTEKIEEAIRISQGWNELKPWNIIHLYLVGKIAKKTAEGLEELRVCGNFIRIADTTHPPSIYRKPTVEFESRRRIEEDIMESLNDDRVCMIAICGAGGVGKTTTVQRIVNRVREDELFDEVVMVVVSQLFDLHKIQKEIAELLCLKLYEETLASRAHKLHIRLMDSKRKLIIFDDVWKSFNLEDIGVPFGNCFMGCKIILTSRVRDACDKMNSQKIIHMEVLTKKEAWTLLKEIVGSDVEAPDLHPIAKCVAAECKGLPVALATVGRALRNQSIHVWRDILSQLKSSPPTDFPEVIRDVYRPLKLSYDSLNNENVKSLFQLCCLFPEDYNIPIELLTLYCIGLGMFEGITKIEQGRGRTHHSVTLLISRFLLINDSLKHGVKMHDVCRQLGIFIGSIEQHGFLKVLEVSSVDSSSRDSSRNCNWMSIDLSIDNSKLPVGSDFPNLRLLMIVDSISHSFHLRRRDLFSKVFDANVICFEGMKGLNVLSFSGINIRSLPPTLELLKELRMLHLQDCFVEDISVASKLANLEILCIHECHLIEELPADIGKLNCLKLFTLNGCSRIKRIVAGVISSLVGLEELNIVNSFHKWEVKGNQSEGRNVGISELESLCSLASLDIEISDCNLLSEEICLSQELVKYHIYSGMHCYSSNDMEHERKIALDLPADVTVGNWIRQLVRSTESLELGGDGSNNFNLAENKSLRKLKISYCSTLKKLVDALDCKFPMLEHLELRMLYELEEIIDGTIPGGCNSFQRLESLIVKWLPRLRCLWKSLNQNVLLGNLKSISITDCPNLCYLFSVTMVRSLVQLQRLEIGGCYRIEQMFWNEMESNQGASIIEFPKLQELRLYDLPNLAAFSVVVEIIEFPQLTQLEITNCPNLRTKIGECPNLSTIQLYTFSGLHELLSARCTRKWNFQLRKLGIRNCDTIEEVFWGDKRHVIFPELRILELSNLPRLKTFYNGVESVKFPKLRWLRIGNLPRLNSILPMDSEPTHDDNSLHFLCNQKVEIPGLKTLYLFNLQSSINKIWCRHVPINFFHTLERLDISDVNGIMSLTSSSIAKNLVNLNYLCMKRCQEIVEVIEEEEEVFVRSLFPNLKTLDISSLHKLRRFCQWKHAFELPSLKEVKIVDCPGMETFTLGPLSTPKLSRFYLNEKQIKMKDLNVGILHFRPKTKDEDEDEDEYNEDGDENKYNDEDEVEYNEDEDEYNDEDEDEYNEDEYSL